MSKAFVEKLESLPDQFDEPHKRDSAAAAVNAVLDAGIKSYAALLRNLQDVQADSTLRLHICLVLRLLGSKHAVKALLTVFANDADERPVRVNAAATLSYLTGRSLVPPLLDLLHHPDPEIRQYAAVALTWTRDKRILKPMLKILNDPQEVDYVRGQVAEALGELGDQRAVQPLIDAVQDETSVLLRWDAIFALGVLGDARAIPVLNKIAASDPRTTPAGTTLQDEAQMAIDHIRSQQATDSQP